jgi:alpha-tubulin suppressor-like RCC1 family protein
MAMTKAMLFIFALLLVRLPMAAGADAPCPQAFEIYKKTAHPFMVKHCAECHGDVDTAGYLGAPLHSMLDPLKAYPTAKQYLKLDDQNLWMNSRLIVHGESGHCLENGGKRGCGAQKGELSAVAQSWIKSEVACNSMNSGGVQNNNTTIDPERARILAMRRQAYVQRQKDVFALRDKSLNANIPPIKSFEHSERANTCILFTNGKGSCLGQSNRFGELGTAPTANSNGKRVVSILPYLPIDEEIIELHASSYRTCALLASGKAKCWGFNGNGNLGIDSKVDTPLALAPYVMIPERIKHLYLDFSRTCALLERGTIKCWGEKSSITKKVQYDEKVRARRKGGKTVVRHVTYDQVENIYSGATPGSMAAIKEIAFNEKIVKMASGGSSEGPTHTCVLLESGKAKCWGNNTYGELGTMMVGTSSQAPGGVRQYVDVPITQKIIDIVLAPNRTCVLIEDGRAKCWGYSVAGGLGIESGGYYGPLYGQTKLTAEDLPFVKIPEKIKSLVLLQNSTCAILETDQVKCWGAATEFTREEGDLGNAPGSMAKVKPLFLGLDTVAPIQDFNSSTLTSKIEILDPSLQCLKLKNENAIRCAGDATNSSDETTALRFPPMKITTE